MEMTRRGFLGSILAASVAPAIVRADSLMPLGRLAYPEYPEFVRDGMLIIPRWRLWKPGDAAYAILEDDVLTCRIEHWALWAETRETEETSDRGLSPSQLGYRDMAPRGAFKFQPREQGSPDWGG